MGKVLAPSEELLAAIEAIDLSMPLMKSLDPKEGDGWSKERAEKAFSDYRKFLYLAATGHASVPTGDIDTAWHRHILDTRAYAADCFRVFGFFLHHFPYFGMRGEDDAKALHETFEQAKADWREVFGEPHPADGASGARSGGSCKVGSYCEGGACTSDGDLAPAEMAAIVDCHTCGPESCSSSGCVNKTCDGTIRASAKCSGELPTDPTKCDVRDDDPAEQARTCDMKACKDCYGHVGDALDLEDWLKVQAGYAPHASARLRASASIRSLNGWRHFS